VFQIRNGSPFATGLTLLPNPAGIDTMYLVVKGTFTLDSVPRVAEDQLPVTAEPEFHGDPQASSLKSAPDLGLAKPSADVIVTGAAYAPNLRPAHRTDVSISIGPVRCDAIVQGDRFWVDSGVGYRATTPEPFTVIPLVWERAFGGSDETASGPVYLPENPVGTGFRAKNGLHAITGTALPNVELPTGLLGTVTDRPVPAGFGAVGSHWEPRRRYAGTYDAAWQENRAPYLPTDFDPRFLQVAPPQLVAPAYFGGGEPIALFGTHPDGPLHSRIPRVELTTEFVLDGAAHPVRPNIDTVVLEPSERRFAVVWRAEFPCDKRALRVSEARVSLGRIS
jgi:hypothetical protein